MRIASYPEKLNRLLEFFQGVTDEEERATFLLAYADRFRGVPPEVAVRPYPNTQKVPFCESEAYAWVLPGPDGTVNLHFAVENPSGVSAKALAAILQETLSGQPAAVVAEIDSDIVPLIFRRNISMGKGVGLTAMVLSVRALAQQVAVAS